MLRDLGYDMITMGMFHENEFKEKFSNEICTHLNLEMIKID
tara:strand:- start:176 stop:298 length:123 start_codon:yes stop_codon:yes gene_type:complete